MRRSIGLVLVGLGVLMLVLAPLLRWYAYPRLAVVSDEVAERVLSGQGVTVLDRAAAVSGEGPVERTTDVRAVRRIVPDGAAGTDDVAVWETSLTVADARAEGQSAEDAVLSYLEERVAFDRRGGHAVEGYEQYVAPSGDEADAESVDHAGYVFKLPFGTEKRSYDVWDTELRATRPVEFDGEDERGGLDVYRFVQRIEPTPVAELDVPGALFDRSGALTAERVYGVTRTLWVEPRTGAIIDASAEQVSFLRAADERGPTVLQGTLSYTDAQVADNIGEYRDTARRLELVRDTLPRAGVVAGAVLTLAGLALARRRRQPGRRRASGVRADPATGVEPLGARVTHGARPTHGAPVSRVSPATDEPAAGRPVQRHTVPPPTLTGAPTSAPTSTPSGASADAAVETPASAAADATAGASAETPAATPNDTSSDSRHDRPYDTPYDTPRDSRDESPAGTRAEAARAPRGSAAAADAPAVEPVQRRGRSTLDDEADLADFDEFDEDGRSSGSAFRY